MLRRHLFLSTVLTCLLTVPASAQDPMGAPTHGGWFQQDTATGNWGGARTRLENRGITPELNFLTDVLSNPKGGLDQDTAFAAGWYGSVTFDLDKLAGMTGLSLFVAGSIQQGRDLSGDDIGNIFGVAQAFNGNVARLDQLYLQQNLYQGKVSIAVGRLAAGDDFATADSYGYYVSGGVNGNPTGILVDFPSFTTSPFAQWGARITANPNDNFYVSAGIYNADPTVQSDDEHGLDFKLNPEDGVLILAEAGITPNQGDIAHGLPGRYVIGGGYDSSKYPLLADPTRETSDNYTFYAIAEQMVYREGGPGSDQGLSLWGTVTVAPDDDINTLPYGIYGGAYYKGLFRGRDNDVTAVAIYYGAFSDDLPGQSSETVVEVNHRFQLAPWLYVTPDFQYIFNPNGGGIPDALVVGFEASVDF